MSYKDIDAVTHTFQCSWIHCQRRKHKHATLEMDLLTYYFSPLILFFFLVLFFPLPVNV